MEGHGQTGLLGFIPENYFMKLSYSKEIPQKEMKGWAFGG